VATQYKKTPNDVGDLWYFLAALANKLAMESQDALYEALGQLTTKIDSIGGRFSDAESAPRMGSRGNQQN